MYHKRSRRRCGRNAFRTVRIRRQQAQKRERRERELVRRQKALEDAKKFSSFTEAQRVTGLPARRLCRWCKQFASGCLQGPGRPTCTLTRELKKLLYEHIDLHGPNVDLLWKTFPWVTRRALEFLVSRWRKVREYFSVKTRLIWKGPGKVWAMDCLKREGDVGEGYVLNVRDLASGRTLAARAIRINCMAEVLRVLRELFARYDRPLVIKSDNGPEFAGVCVQEYLRSQGVIQLFSPAYYPRYNGSCEAGGGGLMCRAGAIADNLGMPGELNRDILEAARMMGNASPRRNRRSPDEEWGERELITAPAREDFLQQVERERERAAKELAEIEESMKAEEGNGVNVKEGARKEIDLKRKSARIGTERALAKASILLVRRSRFPLLKKSR